ncbi:MAG TPA: hypothetical protein VGQ09_02100 [Chitinophagaceae bacterium]|nr:hypothetical protein [Chitinophagaceae bacterium]
MNGSDIKLNLARPKMGKVRIADYYLSPFATQDAGMQLTLVADAQLLLKKNY